MTTRKERVEFRKTRKQARLSLRKAASEARLQLKRGDEAGARVIIKRNADDCKRFGWYLRVSKSGRHIVRTGF